MHARTQATATAHLLRCGLDDVDVALPIRPRVLDRAPQRRHHRIHLLNAWFMQKGAVVVAGWCRGGAEVPCERRAKPSAVTWVHGAWPGVAMSAECACTILVKHIQSHVRSIPLCGVALPVPMLVGTTSCARGEASDALACARHDVGQVYSCHHERVCEAGGGDGHVRMLRSRVLTVMHRMQGHACRCMASHAPILANSACRERERMLQFHDALHCFRLCKCVAGRTHCCMQHAHALP